MTLWIATGNKGKAEEFQLLLKEWELYFLKDLPGYVGPEETGASFEENARIKACSLKKLKVKEWILGEDSGLEVPALDNAPGVYSARYAGPSASDKDNLNLLLKNMKALLDEKRSACFVSHIVMFSPDGKEYSFEGRVEGNIARTPMGSAGFGYDPVFIPKGETLSFAQLGVEYKNHFSHRFQAIEKMKASLTAYTRMENFSQN